MYIPALSYGAQVRASREGRRKKHPSVPRIKEESFVGGRLIQIVLFPLEFISPSQERTSDLIKKPNHPRCPLTWQRTEA